MQQKRLAIGKNVGEDLAHGNSGMNAVAAVPGFANSEQQWRQQNARHTNRKKKNLPGVNMPDEGQTRDSARCRVTSHQTAEKKRKPGANIDSSRIHAESRGHAAWRHIINDE